MTGKQLVQVAMQWHGWELNPQPSRYKAQLFPLSHGALQRLTQNRKTRLTACAYQRSSLQDARACWIRSSSVGFSNENGVKENIDATSEPVKVYNTTLLRDKTKQNQFRITLSNRLQTLEMLMEEETVEEKWKVVKEAVTSSCKQVLGPEKYNDKESQWRLLKKD